MSYTFEDLIESIKERPEIWQSSHPRFCNQARKISWNEISKKLKARETQLRRSWKYLVDQYRKELKAPQSSAWPYFFLMSFLKNEMITRQARRKIRIRSNLDTPRVVAVQASTSTVTQKSNSAATQEEILQKHNEDNNDIESHNNEADEKDTAKQAKVVPFTFSRLGSSKVIENSDNGMWTHNNDLTDTVIHTSLSSVNNSEVSKADLILRKLDNMSVDLNDEDYLFFRSILPMVRTLSPVNKLQLRMKINEYLLQMISDPSNSIEEDLDPIKEEFEDNSWCDDAEDNKEAVMRDIMIDYGSKN